MAYFAEVKNNIVQRVIVADDVSWCVSTFGGEWVETSREPETKQGANIGHTYNPLKDTFIPEKTFPSWVLDSNDKWQAPVAKPQGDVIWTEKDLTFKPVSDFIKQ